jgi:hypothetical protein
MDDFPPYILQKAGFAVKADITRATSAFDSSDALQSERGVIKNNVERHTDAVPEGECRTIAEDQRWRSLRVGGVPVRRAG